MKKYYIYDLNDRKIGEVTAHSILSAELEFLRSTKEYGSEEIYALTTDEGEALA